MKFQHAVNRRPQSVNPQLPLAWKYVAHTPTNGLLLVPVGIAGAIVGSTLLYTLFERPSDAVSQRLKKAPTTRPAR